MDRKQGWSAFNISRALVLTESHAGRISQPPSLNLACQPSSHAVYLTIAFSCRGWVHRFVLAVITELRGIPVDPFLYAVAFRLELEEQRTGRREIGGGTIRRR